MSQKGEHLCATHLNARDDFLFPRCIDKNSGLGLHTGIFRVRASHSAWLDNKEPLELCEVWCSKANGLLSLAALLSVVDCVCHSR